VRRQEFEIHECPEAKSGPGAAGFDALVDKGAVLVVALERWLPV
jgi:hypothetical protein